MAEGRRRKDKLCATCGKPFNRQRGRFCSVNCSGVVSDTDIEVVDLLRSTPDFPPMQFEEIAELGGVSKQRILQVYERALEKLRKRLLTQPEIIEHYGFNSNGQPEEQCDVTHW